MFCKNLFFLYFFIVALQKVTASDTAFLKSERNFFYSMDYTSACITHNKKAKLKSRSGTVETLIDNRINQSVSGVYNFRRKKVFWFEFLSKKTLDTFFNTQNTTAQNKIVVALNDLWFFNSKVEKAKLNFEKDVENFFWLKLGYKAHVYLHDNGVYYPLKKIDTVFTTQKRSSDFSGRADDLLNIALEFTAQAIDTSINNDVAKKRKPITDSVFYKAYNGFKKTIKDFSTQNIRAGVYNTYDDFLNNSPLQDSFNIEFDKYEKVGYHHLFVKSKSSDRYLLDRSAWGAYDGKNLWINSNGYLSVLYLKDGLYYWFGVEGGEDHHFDKMLIYTNPGGGILIPDTHNKVDDFYLKRAIHYLDVNTGIKVW